MSYILEALRKAERERQLGEAPSVSEVLSVEPVKRRNLWPWLVAALLLLNAGVIGYFLRHGVGQGQPSAPAALADPASPVQAEAAKPAKKAPPADPKPAPASVQAENAHVPAAPKPAMAKEAAKPVVVPAKKPAVVPIIDKAFVEGIKPLPAPVQPPVARLEQPEEGERDGGVPSLREMPEDIQRSLPDVKINVLAYSEVPEERFAIINMVRYNRGEHLPGGAVLRDIQANGVVLELNGRRFRVSHR